MAETGGLFSGLKFTDVFLPALAAGASAYNPHIGYGLQTGMNVFNSMAGFQQDLRNYKMIKQEQDLYEQRLKQAQEGTGVYVGEIEKDLYDFRERELSKIRGDIDQHGVYGSEGPTLAMPKDPAKFSEVTGMATKFNVFGDNTLQGQGVDAPRLIPEGTRFSDLVPMHAEDQLNAALAENPDYQALQQHVRSATLAGETMGLSGGSSVSTLGILGEQAHGAALEKARMLQAYKDLQADREKDFLLNSLLKDQEYGNQLNLQNVRTEDKIKGQTNWLEGMARIQANGGPKNADEAWDLLTKTQGIYSDFMRGYDRSDAGNAHIKTMLEEQMAYLQREVEKLQGTPGADTGEDTGAGAGKKLNETPEEAAARANLIQMGFPG